MLSESRTFRQHYVLKIPKNQVRKVTNPTTPPPSVRMVTQSFPCSLVYTLDNVDEHVTVMSALQLPFKGFAAFSPLSQLFQPGADDAPRGTI